MKITQPKRAALFCSVFKLYFLLEKFFEDNGWYKKLGFGNKFIDVVYQLFTFIDKPVFNHILKYRICT